MFSRQLTQICLALFASLVPLSGLAQGTPPESPSVPYPQSPSGDLRVLTVLAMAKAAAELAKEEGARILLRSRVAYSMKLTGQIAMFGSYFSDAAQAWDEFGYGPLSARTRAVIKSNRALLAEAKRALRSGDSESAKEYLGQCKPVGRHYTLCGDGLSFDIRFLHWEAEAGELTAAMHRLKTTDWKGARLAMTVHVARAYVLAGRRSEAVDILRDAGALGPDAYACIVGDGEMGLAAKLRQMACSGQEKAAVEIASALTDVSARTVALAVIAEGLAGIPGYSSDKLEG
jgi:hypothetical protein